MEHGKSHDDGAFRVGCYTKGELAALYFPDKSKAIARQAFRRMLGHKPDLLKELKEDGYDELKVLPPKMVQRIIEVFGFPGSGWRYA